MKDSGAIRVLRDLRITLTAGIHEEQGAEQHGKGPFTVADIAAVNEFGDGRIPSRPWLRGWADGPPAKHVVREIKTVLKDMVMFQDFAPEPMQQVTVETLTSLASQFLDGKLRPNAPTTLVLKAPETRPLVETQQLLGAMRARLSAKAAGWDFEADSPQVTGPVMRQPKFGPRKPRLKKYGPRKPRQYGPRRPKWLLAKSP